MSGTSSSTIKLAFICHVCKDVFTIKVPRYKVSNFRIPASKYCPDRECRAKRKMGRKR